MIFSRLKHKTQNTKCTQCISRHNILKSMSMAKLFWNEKQFLVWPETKLWLPKLWLTKTLALGWKTIHVLFWKCVQISLKRVKKKPDAIIWRRKKGKWKRMQIFVDEPKPQTPRTSAAVRIRNVSAKIYILHFIHNPQNIYLNRILTSDDWFSIS